MTLKKISRGMTYTSYLFHFDAKWLNINDSFAKLSINNVSKTLYIRLMGMNPNPKPDLPTVKNNCRVS